MKIRATTQSFRNSYFFTLTVVIAAILCGGAAFAQTTIHVPADQPTIQGGIDAASNGDTVLVAPGTYVENINFHGKAITVTSSGGAPATIIDGGAKTSVVTFNRGEGPASLLSGFTIQNGNTYSYAGGIQITNSSPTITGNLITGNRATQGLGINVYGGSPLIKNNTITANTQIGSGGGGGGGIQTGGTSDNPSSPAILGNVITHNTLQGGGNGGGIHAGYFGRPIIQNNLIQGNYAYNYGGGISIWSYDGAIVAQNLVLDNSSGGGGGGGGVAIYASSSVALINNTIVGNTAYDRSSGIYVASLSPQSNTIANNIVVAASGQTPVVCDPIWSQSSPVFDHNDFYSATGGISSGVCVVPAPPANMSTEPQFVDPAGDFHLQASSPAIDAGNNLAANLPQADYSGNPRILDGNNNCVSAVDLGAYEFVRAANVGFDHSSLSFASQLVGTTSSPQAVVLANTGNGCFQFSGLQATGDFRQTNNCPAAGLPGGSSCTYSVSFTPTAIGPRSGMLIVAGTDGLSASTPSVSLSGTGYNPAAVSLSTTQLTFGPQPIRTTSAPQSVTLTNTGGLPLNIAGISATAPFAQSNNCPAALAAGAACTISVIFASDGAGTQNGFLTIVDNASGSPHSVSLRGTATDFAVSASPSSATVKHGQAVQLNIGLGPVGGAFNWSVALSCSGLPKGVSCSYSPAAVVPGISGANSNLTISSAGSTKAGTYSLNVVGVSGALQHSVPITLTVK